MEDFSQVFAPTLTLPHKKKEHGGADLDLGLRIA